MVSNMGRKEFEKLKTWWENNVQESTIIEGRDPSAEKTSRAEQLKKLKKLRDHREETDRIKKAQLKRAKAAGSAKESVVTESAMTIGTFVRYKKDKEFTGGKIISIKGNKAEIHNWDGSTIELPVSDLEYVKSWNESVVNEAEVQSDDEFKEYAMAVLKKAFEEDFDEAKAGEVVDGILKKCDGDYGAAVGMLTSSLGESVVTEGFDANKRVIELAKLLKKQKFIGSVYPEGDTIKVFVDSGDTGTTMMWDEDEPGKVRMECEDDSYSETIDDNNDAILNFFSDLDDELDESATNEAFDADKRVVELAKLLKKQKFIGSVYPEGDTIKVFVDSDDLGTTMMWDDSEPGKVRMECEDDSYSETIDDNNAAILNFFENLDDEVNESITNEAIDTKYWADYNTSTSGQGNKEFANKSKDFEDTFSLAVSEWNAEAEGAENRIKGAQISKIKKLAQEFFKKEAYISVNIIQAMIAQES
jgi:hypothetical protein